MYRLMYYLYLFAYIWSLSLGADDFENVQEIDEQEFE
jgi:hypothetical protein